MKRIGDWMQSYTGRRVYPIDLRVEDICIEDIAHSLAYQCRFNGHCMRYYSVAEHSVIVSRHVPPYLYLDGLLHDAIEYCLHDMVKPLKPSFPEYVTAELAGERVIAQKFGTTFPIHPDVKDIDNRILIDERRQLMASCEFEWFLHGEPLGVQLGCWSPKEAEGMFLERYYELTTKSYYTDTSRRTNQWVTRKP